MIDLAHGNEHIGDVEQPLEDGDVGVYAALLDAYEKVERPEQHDRERRERHEVHREDKVLDKVPAREEKDELEYERESADEQKRRKRHITLPLFAEPVE